MGHLIAATPLRANFPAVDKVLNVVNFCTKFAVQTNGMQKVAQK